MAPPSAARVGAFQLGRTLGSGGMGKVFLATHVELGAQVALKALHQREERLVRGFRDEIEATARLDHPHIARVLAHGVSGGADVLPMGTPWFAMELVGSDLRSEVRGMRAWSQLSVVVGQLMDALAHAHGRGVVHRDLKPSNVLFGRPHDQRPGVKLVDFGIAAVGSDSVMGVGTPSCMAPEQWEDDLAAVGPWSDVYGLGVLVWRLVTGRKPIDETRIGALQARQVAGAFDPFRPLLTVPEDLEDWLRTCMAPAAAQRFTCIADARFALQGLLGEARPPEPTDEEITAPLGDQLTVSFADLDSLVATVADGPGVPPAPLPPDWDEPLPEPAPVHLAGAGRSLLPWREPPMVGREDHRAALWSELLSAVSSGTPRVVHLDGPRGVGVSALGRWLVERARTVSGVLGATVQARSSDRRGRGVQDLVDALLQPLGPPGSSRGRRAGLARIGATHGTTVRALEALEAAAAEGAVRPTLQLLRGLARCRPVVVFVDDGSVDAGLRALVDHVDALRGPVLLVTGRLAVGPGARAVELRPLDQTDSSQLLAHLLPVTPELERRLLERAAGRPGVLRRVLTQVDDRLRWSEQGFSLDGDLPGPADDPLPRLADLSEDDLQRLELAAFLGHAVPRALWVRATQLSPEAAEELAHTLVSRGLGRDTAGLSLEPDLAEALRRRASAAGRAMRHHGAAAVALEEVGGDALSRGRAWVRAGQPERGVTVWLDGWNRIIRSLGPRAMSGVLHEAEALLDGMPPVERLHGRCMMVRLWLDQEFRRSTASGAQEVADRAAAEGWDDIAMEALRVAGLSVPRADKEALYDQALARFGDRAHAATRSRLLFSRYMLRERFGDARRDASYDELRATLAEAESTAPAEVELVGGPARERLGLTAQVVRLQRDGRVHEALPLQQRAVELSRRHLALSLGTDLTDMGHLLAAAGEPARADAMYREAGRWAAWLGLHANEALAMANRAGLAVVEGQFERGADLALRGLPGTDNDYLSAVLQLFVWTSRVRHGQWGAMALEALGKRLAYVQPPDHEVVAAIAEIERQAFAEGRALPESLAVLLEVTRPHGGPLPS